MKIRSQEDAFTAMDVLHKKGPRVVILSSADYIEGLELAALVSDRRRGLLYPGMESQIGANLGSGSFYQENFGIPTP